MRKKKKVDRKIVSDPVYGDVLIAKFTNHLMVSGKKSIARKIIYDCFDLIKERTKKDPVEIFQDAINNAAPRVEVVSRRIGGARYQIPKEVSGERKTTLAMRWLIGSARKSHGKSMSEKLFTELTAAAKHEGEAIKKKREIEKIAEANRAFAHFAWR
ncbi:MAG: 30S ribosomal protein S7 [Candidatus Paceibacterota bacterium]|jgi:small subunit ribosomal protein S7